MQDSKIQWCDHTWNPWRGCTKVSPGCAHCYAETMSGRNPSVLGQWGPRGTRVVASETMWAEPLKWQRDAAKTRRRYRVFCASLADVFEDWSGPMQTARGVQIWKRTEHANEWTTSDHYPDTVALTMDDVRRRLFDLIRATPHLDWLLLTKRPENVLSTLDRLRQSEQDLAAPLTAWRMCNDPPHNVWLGVTVEDQPRADERVPELLKIPAAVRFLSCEPLLGPVEFSNVTRRADAVAQLGNKALEGIHWVIIGGESGGEARPFDVAWARSLRDQCKAAGVACFIKQLGAAPVSLLNLPVVRPRDGERLLDKKGGNPDEWPADLRVREFPEVKA